MPDMAGLMLLVIFVIAAGARHSTIVMSMEDIADLAVRVSRLADLDDPSPADRREQDRKQERLEQKIRRFARIQNFLNWFSYAAGAATLLMFAF